MFKLCQVDLAVLAIIAFFTLISLYKGLRQSLAELLITGFSLFTGWLIFQQTHQILKSLLVTLVVFLGLSIFKWIMVISIRSSQRAQPDRAGSSIFDHLLGGVFGFLWGTLISAFLVSSIDSLPLESNLSRKIQNAASAKLLKRLIPVQNIAFFDKIHQLSKISTNPEAKAKLVADPQFQALLEHKSLEELAQDPQTAKLIEQKDIPGLLKNPKFQNLINNGEFLEEMLKIDFEQFGD
ncbi:CvpA family protein [Candidatus Omnitrophota bacterium]